MQRTDVGFPIKFHPCTLDLRINIARFDGQRAVQRSCFVSIAPEHVVTRRDLLQGKKVARIKVNRTLEALQRLLLLPLAPLNVALQFRHHGIIRKSLTSDLQFSQSAIIIEVSSVKVFSACEVCFTRVGSEAKCRLDG